MKLNDYLKVNEIHQSTFAKKIGLSQPTLSRYLSGASIPSVVTAQKIQLATKGEVQVEDWCKSKDNLKARPIKKYEKEITSTRGVYKIKKPTYSKSKGKIKMYTKIYDVRTKYRVSQPELARRSGVSQSQISKYEKGEIAKPSHDKLIRIAEALNCSVEDITDERNSKVSPVFQSFTSSGAAIFIPHYTEAEQVTLDFPKADGVIIRSDSAPSQIRKPSFLEYSDKAYAITTHSASMQPRYKSGDILYVDPNLMPVPNDDVIVLFQLKDKLVGIVREVTEITDEHISVESIVCEGHEKYKISEQYGLHVVVGMQRNRYK